MGLGQPAGPVENGEAGGRWQSVVAGKSNAPCLSPQKSSKMGLKPERPRANVSRENIYA